MELQKHHQDFVNFLKSKSRASATVTAYSKDIEQLIAYLTTEGKSNWSEVTTENLQGFLNALSG